MAPPQTRALRRRAAQAVAQRRERRRVRPRRLAGLWRYLAVIGPGIIVANAGNDAGGIFTYTNTGAKYGTALIWTIIPTTVALIITQEMVARLGVVTGKGLMDLIRERFGVRWTLFAAAVVIIANGGTLLAEFAGLAGGLGLLGVPLPFAVLGGALLIGIVVKIIFLLVPERDGDLIHHCSMSTSFIQSSSLVESCDFVRRRAHSRASLKVQSSKGAVKPPVEPKPTLASLRPSFLHSMQILIAASPASFGSSNSTNSPSYFATRASGFV